MEKNSAKISLGTAICMFVILLLIIALATVYYLGFIKNSEQISYADIAGDKEGISATNTLKEEIKENLEIENSEVVERTENNENEFTTVYGALYKSLTEIKNNPKKLFNSNNKIEEVAILGIEISNYKYLYGEKWVSSEYPDVYNDDNLIIGTCKYGLKLDTLEGLSVAGSGDSKNIGDWFIDNKIFVYNKTTQSIELATGL